MFNPKLPVTRWRVPAPMLMLSLCFMTVTAFSQSQTGTPPDNSATNKVHNHKKTADQQNNSATDREMAAKIRRAVVGDTSLSTYGHNVKIIVTGGAVTLKGPVHSDEEKQNIGAKAADVAGQDKVTNQITVKK